MKRLVKAFMWLGLCCAASPAQEPLHLDESLGETVKRVESLVGNLAAPVKVRGVEIFRDGGTVAVLLQDAGGRFFLFSLEKYYDRDMGEFKPGYIYVGVIHPSENAESRYGVKRRLPMSSDEEKALLSLLQGWKEAGLSADGRAKLSSVRDLKDEKLQQALRTLSPVEYNSLLVLGLIKDLEDRGKPPEVTLEEAEALVDRDEARKLADAASDDIINGRREVLLSKLGEEYGRSPIVGQENKPRDAEGYLDRELKHIAFAHEKVLGCEYKEDGVRWIRSADGRRKPVREVRYSCRTTKRNELNPYLIIEIVPEGTRLAVRDFRISLFPDDYNSLK
jgi:hypothetical protein